MVALTARGNATFRPVKKNGNSDFQMISREITSSLAPAMRAMLISRWSTARMPAKVVMKTM